MQLHSPDVVENATGGTRDVVLRKGLGTPFPRVLTPQSRTLTPNIAQMPSHAKKLLSLSQSTQAKLQLTPQRPENFMTTYSSETKTAELRQTQTTRRSVQYAKVIVDVTNSNYTTMLRCNTPDNLPVLHSFCSRHHT